MITQANAFWPTGQRKSQRQRQCLPALFLSTPEHLRLYLENGILGEKVIKLEFDFELRGTRWKLVLKKRETDYIITESWELSAGDRCGCRPELFGFAPLERLNRSVIILHLFDRLADLFRYNSIQGLLLIEI